MTDASAARNAASQPPAGMSAAEWGVRVNLAAAYRLAEIKGWQEDYRVFNHFTARSADHPDHFLIKPHELLFGEVSASCLLKVNMKANAIGYAEGVNPAGFAIHSAVYLARPDINAAMHVHGEVGMALAAMEGGLKFFNQEGMRLYGRVAYHDWEGVSDVEERDSIARDLGQKDLMILRNHGLLTCGPSVQHAALDLGTLHRLGEAQLRLMASGARIIEVSRELCEKTVATYKASQQKPVEWNAVLRMLDRHDTSYRN